MGVPPLYSALRSNGRQRPLSVSVPQSSPSFSAGSDRPSALDCVSSASGLFDSVHRDLRTVLDEQVTKVVVRIGLCGAWVSRRSLRRRSTVCTGRSPPPS